MVVKIDLEKAYDHLEWSFIKIMLGHFGFPENIINLIMNYVSTTSMGVNLNPSNSREESNKVILFHHICSCCAWSF